MADTENPNLESSSPSPLDAVFEANGVLKPSEMVRRVNKYLRLRASGIGLQSALQQAGLEAQCRKAKTSGSLSESKLLRKH